MPEPATAQILLVMPRVDSYTPPMASTIDSLRLSLEDVRQPALDFLRSLVATNSHTANAEGVRANARLIEQQFQPLGFQARRIPCRMEGTGDHLVLDSGGDGPVIGCIAHLDTVFPPEEEAANAFAWREDGDRVYGPGTYDIKGGTAMIWMMLSALNAAMPGRFASIRWMLIWNAAEEHLAEDFADACLAELPPSTRACLVFEGDNETSKNFTILRARKGLAKFRIATQGRGAHAGNGHANGANAIRELAGLVEELEQMTDHARDLTVNVGCLQGGTEANRVPHAAEARVEMRAYDHAVFDPAMARILALAGEGRVRAVSDGFPCRITVENQLLVPPWEGGASTAEIVAFWQEAAQETGDSLGITRRGGVSDANRLSAHFPTLDGLGPRGGNPHASETTPDGTKVPEFVDISSFVPKALLNLLAILRLLEKKP